MSDNALIRALRSFGQGASNAVASNVSAPVDGIAWLLRKGGLPIPQNPVGGSDWMAQQGLTATPQNRLAGLLGETAGMVGPAVVQAAAPKIAGGLLALDDKAMDMARQGIERRMVNSGMIQPATVWHGSPHKFDKFDSSKIGTGEGAQAYGHGLYLAESPEVAKSYQTALSAERGFSFGGKTGLTRAQVEDMANAKYGGGYLDGVIRPSGVAGSFIDDMVTGVSRPPGFYPRQYKPGSERARLYDELRGQVTHADPGSLYKVDLPDNAIARMLDWDKPLSQQPKNVQRALAKIPERKIWQEEYEKALPRQEAARAAKDYGSVDFDAADYWLSQINRHYGENATGGQVIGRLKGSVSPVEAAKNLKKLGIPGVRYLDQGSRVAGEGSSNFVVFPGQEDILKILERNGVPIK